MARPSSVNVVEAWDDERGQTHLWVDFAGTEVHVLLGRGAVADRKLLYGLAHAEVDGKAVRTIVDDDPQADKKALEAIFAEHLDRWEQHGQSVGGFAAGEGPPPRASKDPARKNLTRRADLESTFTPPHAAPAQAPHPIVHRGNGHD